MTSNDEFKFSGEWNDVINKPELPEGVSLNEYRNLNNQFLKQIAQNDFENGLNAINFPDGFFEIFADTSKIASNSLNITTGSGGNAKCSGGAVNVDDFEDGNVSGWTGDTGNFSASSDGNVISGSFSGLFSGNFGGLLSIDSPSFGALSGDLRIKLRPDSVNGTNDNIEVFLRDDTVTLAGRFILQEGDIIWYDGSNTIIGGYSDLEVLDVEFQMDYANNQVTIIVNSSNLGTFNFENNVSNLDDIRVLNDSGGTTGTNNVYIDDIEIDEPFTDGTLTTQDYNLGYSATKITATADITLNGQSASIEIQDASDDSTIATFSDSEFGDTKTVSTTATSYKGVISLNTDGAQTPQLDNFEVALDD